MKLNRWLFLAWTACLLFGMKYALDSKYVGVILILFSVLIGFVLIHEADNGLKYNGKDESNGD